MSNTIVITNGDGWFVSTVKLPDDPFFAIFDQLIFDRDAAVTPYESILYTLADGWSREYRWNYATEDEAKAGHWKMVDEVMKRFDLKSAEHDLTN